LAVLVNFCIKVIISLTKLKISWYYSLVFIIPVLLDLNGHLNNAII